MLDFCRSCGSPNIKEISSMEPRHRQWECQDCGNKWSQFIYEPKQDESEFVTGDLKDGSEIMYDKD